MVKINGEGSIIYPTYNRENKLDVVIVRLALFFKVLYIVVKLIKMFEKF